MKTITTISIAIVLLCSCSSRSGKLSYNGTHKQAANVEYFKQGQILLPDYAIPDTLIVVNAEGLNKASALFEQGIIDMTDRNIADVMYKFCIVK